jgi:hypothetical protein
MATNFQFASLNGQGLLASIGIKSEVIADIIANGFDVKLTAKELTIVPADLSQIGVLPSMSYPIDLVTLNDIAKGTITLIKKAKLQVELTDAISKFMLGHLKAKQPVSDTVTTAVNEDGDTQVKLTKNVTMTFTGHAKSKLTHKPVQAPGIHTGNAVVSTYDWPSTDLTKLKSQPVVKLREATHMYQPVTGSSPGSRYFMLAANEDVRIGCRLTDSTLSIRIEGPGWVKYAENIKNVGFDKVLPKHEYASVHLTVGHDIVLASKTLGAILMGLGIPLETPLPNLAVIAGK